jgi:hypothetical protein
MIAKAVKGKGFRGALEYDLKEDGQILDTNMSGKTPRELAKEFGQIRKLRPNLNKAVLHVSISAAPGEKLTNEQWIEIARRYLQGMGFTDNQFIITRHNDTEHEHIHILANRIRFDGQVVSDSRDYRRQETIMREIERDFGLQRVAPSIEAKRKAPTKGEIECALRTGQPSIRQQLQQICDAAARNCSNFTEYVERLEAAGVEVIPTVQQGGAKLSGIQYRLDGITMKGSDLGKAYAAAGIQKRGITYEKDRDIASVERCREREAHRAFGEPDRSSEASQTPERGGTGRDAGAVGPSDGSAGRRDETDAGRDRPQESRAGRVIQAPVIGVGEGLQGRGDSRESSRREFEPSRAEDGMETLPARRVDRGNYGGARERILALASTANGAEHAGRTSSSGISEARRDRSLEAIRKQIDAMGVEAFEVGIRDAKTGRMLNRSWIRTALERAIAWLKRMNARGNDIYIRPEGDHGLVLIDDLKPEALERMKSDGFAPAAVIETSPGNFQAWVKLSNEPLPADVRRIAARELANKYGGDPNSADSRHYGRLAGFTNQKPKHARNGRQPYVLAHDCSGEIARAAQAYLERIEQHLVRQEQEKRLKALETVAPTIGPVGYGSQHDDPLEEYRRQAKHLMQRYGNQVDFSRLDWMIATDMAKSGRFTLHDIERCIRECSPNIESRKAGHIDDYARRTASKAWSAAVPDVQSQRQERQAKRSRDFSRSPAGGRRGVSGMSM